MEVNYVVDNFCNSIGPMVSWHGKLLYSGWLYTCPFSNRSRPADNQLVQRTKFYNLAMLKQLKGVK